MKNSRDESSQQENEKSKARLIRLSEVEKMTGIRKSYIYKLMDKNEFPKNRKIVPEGKAVAWVEAEIIAWIKARV